MEKQPERVQRKEITLERAKEIDKEMNLIKNWLEGIERSDRVTFQFSNYTNAIHHTSKEMEINMANPYIDYLRERLNELKEQRENSILIDW